MCLAGIWASGGCQSSPKPILLVAPSGTNVSAARHNDEGIQAYQQQQWDSAKYHFEAAITASAELAEAHYNLGKTLYKLGAVAQGDQHFIEAANLAPGHKIIWDSPPLKRVTIPHKEMSPESDGHMHSH